VGAYQPDRRLRLAAGSEGGKGEIQASPSVHLTLAYFIFRFVRRPQICLAHQLRDCQYAIEAGDVAFAPRMKRLLLRAFVIAKRRQALAAATRKSYKARLERDMDAIMALNVEHKDARRLRKRYGKHRGSLFTFLDHPEIAPDNNGSERALRPTTTYRKVTGGFRSTWGADLYAAVRSTVGTAARHGINAFAAIQSALGISDVYAVG
jgi:transposase